MSRVRIAPGALFHASQWTGRFEISNERLDKSSKSGRVFLVGAGPGDPGLITLRGVECLRQAQVVVYDHLVHPSLLDHAPPDAERINAGKEAGRHTLIQAQIDRLLVHRARRGLRVVRLKGGDPSLFGRGGEEAEALAAARLPFEIVPGVTSATAVPAYAGIPLTHRKHASSVTVITGHACLAQPGVAMAPRPSTGTETLVCLMGVRQLGEIARRLIRDGRTATMPCAIIEWGTLPRQRTVTGTLATIVKQVRAAKITPPAILIVGNVVRLRKSLNWFETKPLFGTRAIVTRPQEGAQTLTATLTQLGADVVTLPAIEAVPLEDYSAADAAISHLDVYHWLFFTSAVGVQYFFRRLQYLKRDVRSLAGVKIGAIGPKTEQALRRIGLRVDFVPSDARQEGMIAEILPETLRGRRVLIARAAQARDVLPDGLRQMGAAVEIAPVYRTLPPANLPAQLGDVARDGRQTIVTFTSSSCVQHLWEALTTKAKRRAFFARVTTASIGPVTSAALREHQLPVHIQASSASVESLTEAIVKHIRSGRRLVRRSRRTAKVA